jgi:hypothetical protein
MDREINKAQFVLMICTEAYYRRVMGQEPPGVGLGIAWEGSLIYNYIYASGSLNTKFIPVVFRDEHVKYIPTPIQGATRYCVSTEDGYEQLYSRLIGRPPAEKPSLGKRKALPRREVKTDFAMPPPTQHGDTGIRVVGGSMRNILIEGFPTGIEGIHTTIDSATVRRHQFSGALFSKDGRFSRLTNTQLKEKSRQVSAKLLSLRTEYEKKCGPNFINIDNATSWVNTEFSNNYREVTAQLAGEIFSRIDPVVVDKMSPISYGGHVVSSGKLDGMEPLQFASYFLEHIAEKLRDFP